MSISGPIGLITKLLAKKAGKAMGNTVAKDIKTAGNIPWTHAEKIKELSTDSGISKSYIQDLISKSSKPDQLHNIQGYLANSAKTGNLTNHERFDLFSTIVTKIKTIEEYKSFKDLVEQGKEFIDHL